MATTIQLNPGDSMCSHCKYRWIDEWGLEIGCRVDRRALVPTDPQSGKWLDLDFCMHFERLIEPIWVRLGNWVMDHWDAVVFLLMWLIVSGIVGLVLVFEK